MNFKLVVQNMLTAAIGTNGKEAGAGGFVAVIGTIITSYLGGWDSALKILIFLMLLDYSTGVLGAFKSRTLNSDIMFWGGIRKGVVLLVVAMSVMADELVSGGTPVFRTLALYFYSGREGLSVVENVGILGVPLPAALTKFLEQLQNKGGGEANANKKTE